MLIVATSPNAIVRNGMPDAGLVNALVEAKKSGNPVGLFSNHAAPAWYAQHFNGSGVQYLHEYGRQNGKCLQANAAKFQLQPHDVIVLATTSTDLHMGKNAGAVVLAGGWSDDAQVKALGVAVDDAEEFARVLSLCASWPGGWWFSGATDRYRVLALADLSTMYKGDAQQQFGQMLTAVVKGGGAQLKALVAVVARSLLAQGFGTMDELLWGSYPSSASANNDTDVLSDFTHRLRTTVSRVQFAKRGQPLFIRHTPSVKRSTAAQGNRTDPANQVETLHLNPVYKNRLAGKNVVVVDDCTTYGLSFGVAEAFLRAAGAKSVTGVALGKFGAQLRSYQIQIISNPFEPVVAGGYSGGEVGFFPGTTDYAAQQALLTLLQS
ncbi:phosphoribosyltransferase [Ralstonia wenshanensis]|uniref:Phosphoribosyltransferase n=1 Tax=Ralstonia wenshanensis TaxID=2842456 RepID=A0AAD2AVH0_9RALS|nr:phosphoribosyltransferase [Ralstonia wenshanensis]CAJ0690731.1 hypothetical protein LMG18091_01325 [Ralstonia wenshanensis]